MRHFQVKRRAGDLQRENCDEDRRIIQKISYHIFSESKKYELKNKKEIMILSKLSNRKVLLSRGLLCHIKGGTEQKFAAINCVH